MPRCVQERAQAPEPRPLALAVMSLMPVSVAAARPRRPRATPWSAPGHRPGCPTGATDAPGRDAPGTSDEEVPMSTTATAESAATTSVGNVDMKIEVGFIQVSEGGRGN